MEDDEYCNHSCNKRQQRGTDYKREKSPEGEMVLKKKMLINNCEEHFYLKKEKKVKQVFSEHWLTKHAP